MRNRKYNVLRIFIQDVALQCRKCYCAVPMPKFYKSFTTNLKRIMTWQQTQQQKCCQQRQQQQQQQQTI